MHLEGLRDTQRWFRARSFSDLSTLMEMYLLKEDMLTAYHSHQAGIFGRSTMLALGSE